MLHQSTDYPFFTIFGEDVLKNCSPIKLFSVLLSIQFYSGPSLANVEDSLPPFYTDIIDSIPDYYQRDGAFGGFPLGGSMYCGPTAASNALIQLEIRTGRLNVLDSTVTGKRQQFELIKKLGSQSYINAGKDGAGPSQICKGLKKIIDESKYCDVLIKHYGWRNAGDGFQVHTGAPPLDTARSNLYQQSAVLINFGWYEYNKKENSYTRKGGHWVTLAGYGHNGKEVDSSAIIIHDPETPWRFNDYIQLKKVSGGTLKGNAPGLPVDASGYYMYSTGFRRVGVIDGFIVVSIKNVLNNPRKNNSVSLSMLPISNMK
jgi:hypothetical protein